MAPNEKGGAIYARGYMQLIPTKLVYSTSLQYIRLVYTTSLQYIRLVYSTSLQYIRLVYSTGLQYISLYSRLYVICIAD